MADPITTKFTADISELKAAMQQAKRSIAVANSEFKAAASTCDDWTKSADGLGAKLKQLDSNLNNQESILESLEKQYELTVKQMGENSKAADDLKIKINNQKAVINNTKKEISKYQQSLADLKGESNDSKTATEKLTDAIADQESDLAKLKGEYSDLVLSQGKNSKQAKTLAKQIDSLSQELKENKTKLNEADKAADKLDNSLDDLEDSAKKAEDGFTVFKGAIASFAGNVLTGFANAIKSGISSLANLSTETREYRSEMAKLDTAFTTNGHSAKTAEAAYSELYGIIGETDQSVEAAQQISLLAKSEEDVAQWAGLAAGVVGRFGDALQPETFYESANETLKLGEATGAYTQMLEGCGVSVDTFNEGLAACKTEEAKQAYMLKMTEELLGEASTAYKETNADVIAANQANADYQDTLGQLGAKVEPVTTALKEGFNKLLQKVLELVEGVDMSAFTAKIQEGFDVLINDVLPAVTDGFGWILDHKDEIIAGLAGIAAGFIAFKVVSIIQGVTNALKGMSLAQAALNLVMSANPIGLIVAAIAGLVTAFVVLWNKSDAFREFWIGLWDGIKEACVAAGDWIKEAWNAVATFFTETIPEAFGSALDWLKENWKGLLTFLINPFAGLFKYFYENNTKFKEFVDNAVNFIKELPSKIWTWLLETINKIGEWISTTTAKAKEMGTKFVNTVVKFFAQLPSKIWTWLTNVISKVTDWAAKMANKAKSAAQKFVEKVVSTIKELPSKVWTWLKNTISKVTSWASEMAEKAKSAAKKFVDKVVNTIKELPSKIWTWLSNAANKVVTWGSNLASKGTEAAKKLLNAVVDKVKEIPSKVKSIGSDIVKGLWNGINDMTSWIGKKIKGFGDNVLSGLKDFFGIHSPSRVMKKEVGLQIAKGVAEGIEDGIDDVESATQKLGNAVLTETSKFSDSLGTSIETLSEKVYTLEKDYADKTAAVWKKYSDNISTAGTDYEDALTERSKAISSSMGLFDMVSVDAFEREHSLTDALYSQISALQMFDDGLENLAKRGVDSELIDELRAMGVSAADEILQLNMMSDSELNNYVALWQKKTALARKQAITELAGDFAEKVEAIRKEANEEAAEIKSDFEKSMNELASEFVDISEEAVKNGITFDEDQAKKYKEVGEKLLGSLAEGATSESDALKQAVEVAVNDALETVEVARQRIIAKQNALWAEETASLAASQIYNLGAGLLDITTARRQQLEAQLSAITSGLSNNAVSSSYSNGTQSVAPTINNYNQTINSPKALNRLEIYRQSKNLLGLLG